MDLLLLAALALIAWGGYKIALNGLEIYDNHLAGALGLPLGLFFCVLINVLADSFLPLWWCLAIDLLVLGSIGYFLPRPNLSAERSKLDKKHKVIISLIILSSVFYVHAVQVTRVSQDFWYSYPLTRSLVKGSKEVRHPFFPWLKINNTLSQAKLTATLAYTLRGDTLRTQWICELVFMINSIILWVLFILKITDNGWIATFGVIFLFMGINVGDKIGLMDAFDNGDLLVFFLLGSVLTLLTDIIQKTSLHIKTKWPQIIITTVVCGLYGIFCLSYLFLALICFCTFSLIIARRRRSLLLPLTISILICFVGSLLFALYLERSSELPILYAHVPKKNFLQIRLGSDPYRRLSNVLDTVFLRHYKPIPDDGGYTSIFSIKFLLMHWLPTWLAPLTISWAIYRRNICGCIFALFGSVAYFTPAIVDFGPLRESEYFRWELAAGLGFAGLAAFTVGDLWSLLTDLASNLQRRSAYLLLIIFVCANLIGAEKLMNNIIIQAQQDRNIAKRILWPWYQNTEKWMLAQNYLQLNQRDLDLARWLWSNAKEGDVVWREHQYNTYNHVEKCSTLNGLAGTLSCEHIANPDWMPLGTPPYWPNYVSSAFAVSHDPSLISGLGANWLISSTTLKDNDGITLVKTFGDSAKHYLYKIENPLPCKLLDPQNLPSSSISLQVKGIPQSNEWMAGRAYPIDIKISQTFKGWLKAVFIDKKTSKRIANTPSIGQFIDGQKIKFTISPPLNEGKYKIVWLLSPDGKSWQKAQTETEADYCLSKNIEENLRLKSIKADTSYSGYLVLKNIGNKTFNCDGPLNINIWVWSQEIHGYRGNNFESQTKLLQSIPPGGEITLNWSLPEELPQEYRLDVGASAVIGQNNSVMRL